MSKQSTSENEFPTCKTCHQPTRYFVACSACGETLCEDDCAEMCDDCWPSKLYCGSCLKQVTPACEDCGGTGVDPGSLNGPEPCLYCQGSGKADPETLCPDHAAKHMQEVS